jgi:hypothetical protein
VSVQNFRWSKSKWSCPNYYEYSIRMQRLLNLNLVEKFFKEIKMEKVEKRLEQLESQLKRARWRALFVWGVGLILMAGTIVNVWLPPASAQGEQRGLEQRVTELEGQISALNNQISSQGDEIAALYSLLAHFSREGNDVFINGANLHITNGLDTTESSNGLGNLIVGYNELRPSGSNDRTGSHNIVVGKQHNFTSFGGFVAGEFNDVGAPFASVSGGAFSRAVGRSASVSGGHSNSADSPNSSVSGGIGLRQGVSGGWSAGSQGVNPVVGNFRSP